MEKITLIVLAFFLGGSMLTAQTWVDMMLDSERNFYEVQEAFNEEWQGRSYERGKGWKQFKRWEYFMEQRVYPSGDRIPSQSAYLERVNFEQNYGVMNNRAAGWAPLGPNDWNSISYNPGIGRVNVIVEDPTNNQVVYAGTPSGGLWKTTNGGTSWTPLTDDFSAIGISGIAVDYTNPDIIYVSTGDGDGSDTYSIGVMKSTDGGTTWQPTGLIHTLSQFVISRKLIMHPTNPQILIVATNEGLLKTIDGGDNWNLVASGSFRDVDYHSTDFDIVFASTNRFYRSTNGGDTFTIITNGLPAESQVNRMAVAVSPDQPEWVYALCGKDSDASFLGLYCSTDGGQTFSLRTSSPNLFGYSETGDDDAGQSWYDMALAVDPSDASVVFVGGINVWSSLDGGFSFEINSHWVYPSFVGYTHADIHSLDFYGGNLYCGSDGGIFKTTNYGIEWNDLTPGMEISQFYRLGGSPQNADLIIGGTQDNGSNLMNGTDWTHVMGADGMEAAIHPTNADIMFCTQQFGGMHRSTDGGNSWDFIMDGNGEGGGWITPYVSLSNNKLIAGYENVWLSTNNGGSFNSISNFASGARIRDLAVAQSNQDVIYVSFIGSIHRTTNNGGSWSNITSNLPDLAITDICIHPNNPDIVWVTMSGYSNGSKVFVTTNGGGTWKNISQNLPNLPANAIVFQEGSDGGLYVGMDVGVYYTDSTLSNWQTYDQDMPNVIVSELEIHYGTNKIRAATFGRGIWESDLYSPSALPPTADFYFAAETLCSQDSVAFYDASVNASPSWTWYFPGGSPATSSFASPNVFYVTPGVYTASLVVENANGTDSIAKVVEVNIGEVELELAITTDNYPTETTWAIFSNTGEEIRSGGGYGQANTFYSEIICLSYDCYEFVIYDSYGDGICCDFGNGSYSLSEGMQIHASGGDFGSSESTDFCLTPPTNIGFEEQFTEQFKIYPNPASSKLTIEPFLEDEYQLKIWDASGRVIHQVNQVVGSRTIEVSNFASGIYIIGIETGNGITKERIVIER